MSVEQIVTPVITPDQVAQFANDLYRELGLVGDLVEEWLVELAIAVVKNPNVIPHIVERE